MSVMDVRGSEQPSLPVETDADRVARVRRELAIVACAEADIDAGRGIEEDALEAWLDALDVDDAAPVPSRGGRGAP